MILKELNIRNFRSYYGDNNFEFKDGLTLIIGGNGDGKTTFFDALDWLFDTAYDNSKITNISEKSISELEIGENEKVSVSLTFEHDGIKVLEKQFRYEKLNDGQIKTRDYLFQGYDCIGSERALIDGRILLERCFDSVIRKYCLFKGESELNVFENPAALKTLVEKFSDIKKFEDLLDLSTEFERKSNEAYRTELKSDDKVSKVSKELDFDLIEVNRRIKDLKDDIAKKEEVANAYQIKVETLEKHQETSEKYHTIKDRIINLNGKRQKLLNITYEDYNVRLLDDLWILSSFPDIFKEYTTKVSRFSKQKRALNDEYIEKRGIEKGKQEAIAELTALANGSTHLPWYLPDDQTMQEMIEEEICKVCNRPAPKGSDAYNFMKEKLDQYLKIEAEKAQAKVDKEESSLFESRYIEELHNLSISLGGNTAQEIAGLYSEIKARIEFINNRKLELVKVDEQIKDAEEEKQRLLIQSDGVSEDLLEKNFKDIKGFFEEKTKAEARIKDLKEDLEVLIARKKDIERRFSELTPSKGMVQLYSKVHIAFEKIMTAFESAKKSNLRKFLNDLETRANEYLKFLNIDDFHGIIRITETINDSASIKLYSENGTFINDPNGALKTTVYMSVLFAISDITTIKREIDYPLVFDAPTSSFETFKEEEFYNVIDKIQKQCIIVTKDLLEKDEVNGARKLNDKKINELSCSVYRIEKARPFNPNDLSTIYTITTKIK